jgi:hypothetical protein
MCLSSQSRASYGTHERLSEISILVCALATTASLSLRAGASAQEKAFIDKYKTAFEAKDTTTLESFFFTQGADPAIVDFYKMMQFSRSWREISKIELVDLTPEDVKKAATPMDSPAGGKVCLTLKPTKKLIIKIDKKKPTVVQPARLKISSLRKTANSSFPFRGDVNKISIGNSAILWPPVAISVMRADRQTGSGPAVPIELLGEPLKPFPGFL